MKKSVVIKVFALIFAVVTAVVGATACGGNSGGNSIRDDKKDEYKPAALTSNGEDISNYNIVISSSPKKSDEYAAEILQQKIKQVTGVTLSVIGDDTSETPLEIILGKTTRKECENVDYAALGEESYIVKIEDKDLVIAGNDRGLIYGVYAYLEALGFRFYTPDTEKIPFANDVFVPEKLDLSWTPIFEYRETMYAATWNADYALSQKINSDFQRDDLKNNSKYGGYVGYIGGGAWLVHTFQYLLSPLTYYSEHPEYFAEINGVRMNKADKGGTWAQPCLSSEGAYQEILANALKKIATEPNGKMISISENDGASACQCAECRKSYEKFGESGTFFRYLNRLAKDIAKVYPDVYIDTLSYSLSKNPPENLEIADNIIVRVCPEMCRFHTDPKECERLAADEKRIVEWKKICKNTYVYWYPIVWANLFAAIPNYDEMLYDVRYFAEQGVKGVYAEGYPGSAAFSDPEFGELKAYLTAKLMANPYMSESEYKYHYRDFLEGYYGEAAEYIEKYHEYTKKMIKKNEQENGHYAGIFSADENFLFEFDRGTRSYDLTDIDYVNSLWENATEATYGKTLDHVKKSRIHWVYIELYNTMDNRVLYGDENIREELYARNEELYRDMVKYKTIKKFSNAYVLQEIKDFTLSPKKAKWLRP